MSEILNKSIHSLNEFTVWIIVCFFSFGITNGNYFLSLWAACMFPVVLYYARATKELDLRTKDATLAVIVISFLMYLAIFP